MPAESYNLPQPSRSALRPLCPERKFYRFLKQFAFMVSSTLITRLPGRKEQRLLNDHRPQCGPRVQARGILRCCLRFRNKFLSKYGNHARRLLNIKHNPAPDCICNATGQRRAVSSSVVGARQINPKVATHVYEFGLSLKHAQRVCTPHSATARD